MEHEAFLCDLLAEAELVQKLIPQPSGPLYDLVESVVGTRVDWRCGEKMFQRHVIRLDPEQVEVKIESTGHVFPTHSDSLRHIIDAVIKEIPVWRKGIKDPPTD